MRKFLVLFSIIISITSYAQQKKKVLFLGNSYTYVNDLPSVLKNLALSADDTLEYGSNLIGGYTLQGHSTNTTSTNLIKQGGWDYMVLQEQSQLPSFPISQVNSQVFPYATQLNDLYNQYNTCGETVFYMTWGRKNGDSQNCSNWPPVCTYNGMDSLLHLRYRMMADNNEAYLAPVGALWHYIRTHNPSINLYDSDESHPSPAGTYAAACTFYSIFFQKDITASNYNFSLDAATADTIRKAAKLIVYDSLDYWNVGKYTPIADFDITNITDTSFQFTNNSLYATNYKWNFGDGNNSTDVNPQHVYTAGAGTYTVQLIVEKCGISDTLKKTITITGIKNTPQSTYEKISVYPNPVRDVLNLKKPRNYTYSIYNSLGNVILKTAQSDTIDMSKMSEGIYYIQFIDNGKVTGLLKLMKE